MRGGAGLRLLPFEFQRGGIDTIAGPGRRGAVVEHVTQMSPARAADDLRPALLSGTAIFRMPRA